MSQPQGIVTFYDYCQLLQPFFSSFHIRKPLEIQLIQGLFLTVFFFILDFITFFKCILNRNRCVGTYVGKSNCLVLNCFNIHQANLRVGSAILLHVVVKILCRWKNIEEVYRYPFIRNSSVHLIVIVINFTKTPMS